MTTMATQLTLAYAQEQRLAQAGDSPVRRRIRDLPASDRPLYRLVQHGCRALSNAELLALVLGRADGLDLAQELLVRFGSLHRLARANRQTLTRVRGIGPAQAARLAAVLELSRRLQLPDGEEPPRVTCPSDAVALLAPAMAALDQEELRVMLLDTRNRVLGVHTIYKGSLNTSVVRVGEIFRPAIEAPAAAIIVAHNHPSTDPSPSPEDVHVTRQIAQAGKLLDIEVLDHLIVASGGRHVSLKERNLGGL
jgi:DNA repair protein RadC